MSVSLPHLCRGNPVCEGIFKQSGWAVREWFLISCCQGQDYPADSNAASVTSSWPVLSSTHTNTHTPNLRKTSKDDPPHQPSFNNPPELKLILKLTSKPADGRQRRQFEFWSPESQSVTAKERENEKEGEWRENPTTSQVVRLHLGGKKKIIYTYYKVLWKITE